MFRQVKAVEAGGATATDVAFDSDNAVGSLLVLVADMRVAYGGNSVAGVTDSQGNAWTQAHGGEPDVWYAPNAHAGANTVHVVTNGSGPAFTYWLDVVVLEYDGMALADVLDVLTARYDNTSSGNTAAALAGDLVIGTYFSWGGGGTPTDGKTTRANAGHLSVADTVAVSAGVQSATFAGPGSAAVACVCFKAYVPSIPYRDAVMADAPEAYWRLGDSGGAAVDHTGNGHDGALVGGIVAGVAGAISSADTAMTFDGSR